LETIIFQGSAATRLGVVRFVINLYCKLFDGHNTDRIGKTYQYVVKIWTRAWSSIFGPSCTTRLQTPEVYLKLNKI